MRGLLVEVKDYFDFIVAVGAEIHLALEESLFSALELAAIIFLTTYTLSRFTFSGCVLIWLKRAVAQLVWELADLVQHSVA